MRANMGEGGALVIDRGDVGRIPLLGVPRVDFGGDCGGEGGRGIVGGRGCGRGCLEGKIELPEVAGIDDGAAGSEGFENDVWGSFCAGGEDENGSFSVE